MDPTYTDEYEQFELRHWWFVARREIIHQALDAFANPAGNPRWLDVGCGSGVLLNSYSAISNKVGVELDAGSVQRAQKKGLDVRQIATSWNFRELGMFDLITLTDVIEHVEDERQALSAVREVLKDDGVLLITVPALMSLWSGHDVINRHFRRYTRAGLLRLFPKSEWTVLKSSYFSSLLLPLIWAARKWKNFSRRGHEAAGAHDFKFGPFDPLFRTIFRLEKPRLKFAGFPLGSSVLLVVKKRGKSIST